MKTAIGAFFFLVALVFVYRSFYGMRIPGGQVTAAHFFTRPPGSSPEGGFVSAIRVRRSC